MPAEKFEHPALDDWKKKQKKQFLSPLVGITLKESIFIFWYLIIYVHKIDVCRSQWPHGLRCRSAAAWLLGLQVWILFGSWMFVSCLYVVLSCVGRSLCNRLITRPEESYRVSNVCVITETPKGALCSKLGTKRKWMNIDV
jgi:hypothetical protein